MIGIDRQTVTSNVIYGATALRLDAAHHGNYLEHQMYILLSAQLVVIPY